MCGLAGFWSRSRVADGLAAATGRMTGALAHRGPDDAGVWCDEASGLALGHRRLSIVDLSAAGHQPMHSAGGRYAVVFNGEIYNFAAIRAELESSGPVAWRGHSDTEVLLAAVERWGVAEAIGRCAGMFALALWDAADRTLHLIRDRAGEKPLYYGVVGDTLLFGSELKALRAHPAWRGDVDRGALALFLRHNYVPAPYSIYAGVRKVLPGTMISATLRDGGFSLAETAYWSARAVAERGVADPLPGDDRDHADALEALLREVIGEQMVADVPLGAFLSGGVDSSAVVALMQAQGTRPTQTFTIGFHESGFDEATHARAVANHLGTDHTELYVTADETRDVIPTLPHVYDEPFADSSQIPTILVSRLARRSVTVSLSGDGGDELFAGYPHYATLDRVWAKVMRVPGPARRLLGAGLGASAGAVHELVGGAGLHARLPQMRHRLDRLAGLYRSTTVEGLHRQLVSQWADPAGVVLGGREPAPPEGPFRDATALPSRAERAMLLDFRTYVPDDVMVKVDRAAMSVSLETRAPLLDHRVVELAWRLPMSSKLRDGRGKHALRAVLYRHVPSALIDRPKQGFSIPVGAWLRGPLRAWADDLLEPGRLRREGYLAASPIARRWREHRDGRQDWTSQLWPVLMYQSWLEAS